MFAESGEDEGVFSTVSIGELVFDVCVVCKNLVLKMVFDDILSILNELDEITEGD
jgi:hypothetical protein